MLPSYTMCNYIWILVLITFQPQRSLLSFKGYSLFVTRNFSKVFFKPVFVFSRYHCREGADWPHHLLSRLWRSPFYHSMMAPFSVSSQSPTPFLLLFSPNIVVMSLPLSLLLYHELVGIQVSSSSVLLVTGSIRNGGDFQNWVSITLMFWDLASMLVSLVWFKGFYRRQLLCQHFSLVSERPVLQTYSSSVTLQRS